MKLTNRIFGAALISISVLVSCAKETPVENNKPTPEPVPVGEESVVIRATATVETQKSASQVSKTAISDGDDNTKVVTWLEGDKIAIFCGEERKEAATAATGTSGSFEFEIPTAAESFITVTPSSTNAASDGVTSATVLIPSTQDGTFANANIAVAKAEKDGEWSSVSLQFSNMVSLFKVVVEDDDVTKLVLTAKGGEAIAGLLPVSFDGTTATPEVSNAGETESVITAEIAGAGTYYIAVLPGQTYSLGVRLDVYKGDEQATTLDYETSDPLTLTRSTIASFGTVSMEFIGAGLTDLYATIPNVAGKFYTTRKFPYKAGENIMVHIPGADDALLSNVNMFPSLDEGNTIYPELTTDYTVPFTMNIRDSKGHIDTHTLGIDTRKATLSQVWSADATAMGLSWTNRMRLAADKDYVYVLDNIMNYQPAESEIRVLDRKTGALVKTMGAPSQYLGDINVDDGGNLIVTRYNCMWGCGLLAYVYNPTSGIWDNFLYWASETTPDNVGERVSVVGNVKSGTAYMYATTNNSKSIYRWTITDGCFQYGPTYTEEYAGVSTPWHNAIVRRASTDDNSPVYIGITTGTEGAGYQDAAAYFAELGTANSISQDNFGPRILNYKTFKVENEEYLAVVYQWSWERYATAFLKVFNITDRERWTMVAESPRYDLDFNTCSVSGFAGGTNYDQSGGLDVTLCEDGTFIYVGLPCKGSGDPSYDAANSKVVCFKFSFE